MRAINRKVIKGWIMYDWANSVYNLVISSAIFPIFYDTVTSNYYKTNTLHLAKDAKLPANTEVLVNYFGFNISNSVALSFTLCFSFLVVSFLSPMLSGIADYVGNKKRFMQFFCYLGSLSCMGLFFFNDLLISGHLEIGMAILCLASIGFWNSLVFYNAYLPEIAHRRHHDKISAKGFTMGYIGSMTLLICCLVAIKVFHVPAKFCFLAVGVWWIIFAQYTFRILPNNIHERKPEKGVLMKGLKELAGVWKEFKHQVVLKRYLFAYFFFNTGVQTVMLMATIFARKEINWPIDPATGEPSSGGLITAILLIQILGAVGAMGMSKISSKIGNIVTLRISLVIWISICAIAYFITTPVQFYILACMVGLVMGGVQAIARSTYSKLLPISEDNASYFSFYDATEKIGIVIGTFFFGFMELLVGMRGSVLSIGIFFIIGFLLLFLVKNKATLRRPQINLDNN
jgi:UMF1 family MFS transporter